ncbi:copper resistance D family protein [Paenibacillus sp. MMO-177]|uniref:copper resistance D family protein n=1 Tax=Paenibacillus sp. MMO-177 TaxID=3081289 RepID=UPI00301AB5A9
MTIITWLSELLLYVSFSLLAGYSILTFVPARFKPEMRIPNKVIILAAVSIPILAFMPILRIVLFFAGDIGFGLTIKNVLFSFEEGKAYFKLVITAIVLIWFLIRRPLINPRHSSILTGLLTIIMALILSSASHLASLIGWQGVTWHFLHFVAAISWAGTLLVTGCFSLKPDHWQNYLKWMTPLGIICLIGISVSGLFMLQPVAPDYVDSWVLSYGQALLLKHIAVIPLILFAFMNGVLYRYKQKRNTAWNPLSWIRMEGVAILVVFLFTGYMGQQSPPHDVSLTVRESGSSSWFQFLVTDKLPEQVKLIIALNGLSVMLGVLAIFTLALLVYKAWKSEGWKWPQGLGLIFIAFAYLSLMTAVTFQ